MSKLAHVLLPCKMTSGRVHRKNLRTVARESLLHLAIRRFRTWYPETKVWVATEDAEAAQVAIDYGGCEVYPLIAADVNDQRNGAELFAAWLAERNVGERCMVYQVTSPFVYRSELELAIHDPRPCCRAAWVGTLHFPQLDPQGRTLLSQVIPATRLLAGNFMVATAGHVVTGQDEAFQHSPVSWLSAIDINTAADLTLADHIASAMPLASFDDLVIR